MDARKVWLKHLAASPQVRAWVTACDPSVFEGTARVQTRNTTYLFRNGSCFAVTYADASRGTSSEFVGMKIVGWVLAKGPDDREPRLSRTWREGASAVLWGSSSPTRKRLPVALTSPTVRFALFRGEAPAGPRPARLDRAPYPTFTRINLPGLPSSVPESAVRPIARAV